jgi:hypothetical protein
MLCTTEGRECVQTYLLERLLDPVAYKTGVLEVTLSFFLDLRQNLWAIKSIVSQLLA